MAWDVKPTSSDSMQALLDWSQQQLVVAQAKLLELQQHAIHTDDSCSTQRRKMKVKINLQEFDGMVGPRKAKEWILAAEKFFESEGFDEELACMHAVMAFTKSASYWYETLKRTRARKGKTKIRTWSKLKKHFQRCFIYKEDVEIVTTVHTTSMTQTPVQAIQNREELQKNKRWIEQFKKNPPDVKLSYQCFKCKGFGRYYDECPTSRILSVMEVEEYKLYNKFVNSGELSLEDASAIIENVQGEQEIVVQEVTTTSLEQEVIVQEDEHKSSDVTSVQDCDNDLDYLTSEGELEESKEQRCDTSIPVCPTQKEVHKPLMEECIDNKIQPKENVCQHLFNFSKSCCETPKVMHVGLKRKCVEVLNKEEDDQMSKNGVKRGKHDGVLLYLLDDELEELRTILFQEGENDAGALWNLPTHVKEAKYETKKSNQSVDGFG